VPRDDEAFDLRWLQLDDLDEAEVTIDDGRTGTNAQAARPIVMDVNARRFDFDE
jgi:hypothetical protein